MRGLQHSLRARARNQQDCISSHSCTDDDDINELVPTDILTQQQQQPQQTVYEANEIDTDSPSITQSKSTESYSPLNVVHPTKTTRSLSLHPDHSHFSMTSSLQTDSYFDEVNSD